MVETSLHSAERGGDKQRVKTSFTVDEDGKSVLQA